MIPERPYDDETTMHYGIHKGTRLSDLPPDYLLWLWRNKKAHGVALKTYIFDHLDDIMCRNAINSGYYVYKK